MLSFIITFATGPVAAYLAFQLDPSLALGAFLISFPIGAIVGAKI